MQRSNGFAWPTTMSLDVAYGVTYSEYRQLKLATVFHPGLLQSLPYQVVACSAGAEGKVRKSCTQTISFFGFNAPVPGVELNQAAMETISTWPLLLHTHAETQQCLSLESYYPYFLPGSAAPLCLSRGGHEHRSQMPSSVQRWVGNARQYFLGQAEIEFVKRLTNLLRWSQVLSVFLRALLPNDRS